MLVSVLNVNCSKYVIAVSVSPTREVGVPGTPLSRGYLPEVVLGSGDSLGMILQVLCPLIISNSGGGWLQVSCSGSVAIVYLIFVIVTLSFKRSGDESRWLAYILIGSSVVVKIDIAIILIISWIILPGEYRNFRGKHRKFS